MEHGREDRLDAPRNGRAAGHPAPADARHTGLHVHSVGRRDGAAGDRRQRVLAESGPPQRAFAERLQVGFPFQHRRFGGALRGAGGPGAPCGALVRHARNRADRPGFLPAAAAQRPVRRSEYDFHSAVPFRAALEGDLPFVAGGRAYGHCAGDGRVGHLEPRGGACDRGRDADRAAVVVERLAPLRQVRAEAPARDGAVRVQSDGDGPDFEFL